MAEKIVFLFDVDNTLLDNDGIGADLKNYLKREVGSDREAQYWTILEELRTELGYVDYLGALQRYRLKNPLDAHVLSVSHFLINYPFAERLFPKSLEVVEAANRIGQAVILSDGDVVFQPHKIRRSGLFEAVRGNVLIYVHKEQELADVRRRFPADHYVLIDDKLRILSAVKRIWGAEVTTIFPQQGHYAHDPAIHTMFRAADRMMPRIGDFLDDLHPEFSLWTPPPSPRPCPQEQVLPSFQEQM